MIGLAGRLAEAVCRYVPPSEATAGPHGLFRYPAKYLPQIAAPLLAELSSTGPVLDPFAGSGTTLVEASRLGVPSVGLDLNPLAVLIASVKVEELDSGALLSAGDRAVRFADRAQAGEAPVPEFRNRELWFPPEALDPLARLRAAIESELDPVLRRALLVIFLSIVKKCSNASTYQHKLTRSRCPEPVVGEGVKALFLRRVRSAANRFLDAGPRAASDVLLGDARRLPFPDEVFEAVITHPPYSISFDFVRSFKLYIWWLDPGRDTVALDRLMVGNQRRMTGPLPDVGVTTIDAVAREVYSSDRRDGLAVAWFFRDMDRVILECRRVLRPGGSLALYMGDSQARWVALRAPDALAALAKRAGFRLRARVPRETPRRVAAGNRQIHVEELLVFQAP